VATPARKLTRRELLVLAWPVILANAAVPLPGLAATAVIGHFAASRISAPSPSVP